MATVTININGISEGWTGASGAATDIDEAVASADGSEYGPGAEADPATFDLGAHGLGDNDTITNVSITVRMRDSGSAGTKTCNVDFLIGGTPQGSAANTGALTSSHANYSSLNDAGWNSDWSSSQLDGAQVRLTPAQSGMPGTNAAAVDCVDVVITYTPETDFDQLGFRFYADSATDADSLTGLAAENTNATMADPSSDTHFHLRVEFDETSSNGTSGFNTDLWVSKNGGAYAAVTASSSNVQSSVSGMACTTTNGDATLADLLTTSAKTFAQAEYDNNNTLMGIDGAAGRHYENHYALKMIAADVTSGDTFDFRVQRTTEGAFGTYTRTGRLTLTGGTKTKTLSADALLQKQNILLTASADSLLQKQGIEKTLSADALLQKTVELTASADALLQKLGVEQTLSADALLQKLGIELTTSADALLVKTTELTLSADALLQKTIEITLSADALLRKDNIAVTLSADALLQKAVEITLVADALLQKTVTATLSADSLLQKNVSLTLSADAILNTVGQKTVTLVADALLQKVDITLTLSADAVLTVAAAAGPPKHEGLLQTVGRFLN